MQIKLFGNKLDGYYDTDIQDFVVTNGIIPAHLRYYKIYQERINYIFDNWLKDDIRVILVKRDYIFNLNNTNYNDIKFFELNNEGYDIKGQIIKNKTTDGIFVDGENMKWFFPGIVRNRGAIIYNNTTDELIAYVDYMFEAEVVDGTLSISWGDKGIISREFYSFG